MLCEKHELTTKNMNSTFQFYLTQLKNNDYEKFEDSIDIIEFKKLNQDQKKKDTQLISQSLKKLLEDIKDEDKGK